MNYPVYNFGAGPAMLPRVVLEQVQAELLDWHGRGISVMEMSHRGADYMQIIAEAEQDLRDLLQVPAHYKVLFLQGGATLQFAMVPHQPAARSCAGELCADRYLVCESHSRGQAFCDR
jgi:phosphoserine aminotransferase apoenzyme (EC 2.6.1.52)